MPKKMEQEMNRDIAVSKNITVLATYLFLVPLVYFIPPAINQLMTMPKLINVSLSVGIIVLLMSYLIMPVFTQVYLKIMCKINLNLTCRLKKNKVL
jgi:uncharacterized membrane protein (DUF485 family)